MINERCINDMLTGLSKAYHKIIRINLDRDTFVPVYVISSEWNEGLMSETVAEWAREFALSGGVREDEVDLFLEFIDTDRLLGSISNGERNVLRYHRRVGDGYHLVLCEVVPCNDFGWNNNHQAIMYIQDIDFLNEELRLLEDAASTDALTGLGNRRAYNDILQTTCPVCVMYCDVNNLKLTNDTCGHDAGDRLILGFVDLLKQYFRVEDCYRVGGDEFVVVVPGETSSRVEEFYGFINSSGEKPVASVGYSVGSIDEAVHAAESMMYAEKERHHNM